MRSRAVPIASQSPPRSDVPLAKAANQEGGQVGIRIQTPTRTCDLRVIVESLGGAGHVEHNINININD